MCSYRSRLQHFIQALCIMAGVWQGSTSLAANSRFIAFDSDASTEISTNTVYTHLMDFGTASGDYENPVVNDVTFTSVSTSSGTLVGTDGNSYGWSGFPASNHPGWDSPWIWTPAGNNIRKVLTDMNLGLASGTIYLSGLTPGQKYEVRFYNRTWSAGNRYQTFTFQPGSSAQEIVTFNEDDWTGEKILAYPYVADANGELVVGIQAADSNATYHFYGLSNQKIMSSFFSSGTTVTNDNGHYFVGATLGGYNAGAEVTLVWGLSAGSFSFTNSTTTVTAGQPIYLEATNVTLNTSYFYKMFVSENGQVVDVAQNASDSFFTGERDVWITQSGAMNEVGPTSVTLTFHRSGVTSEALQVAYDIGGTAIAGLDYLDDELTGTIEIPEGETSVDLLLTPIRNFAMEQSLNVSITLQAGPYAIVEPSSQTAAITKSPTTYTESTYSSAAGSMIYRVYTPNTYSAQGEKIPVVLYLHSAAERGSDWNAVFANNGWRNNWINNLITETQVGSHQAVLVIPQSGAGQVWNSMNNGDYWSVGNYTDAQQGAIGPRLQLAKEILDVVVNTYNIASDRVYLTGGSMGGYGAWDMLARFPGAFAAAMPLSGGGNSDASRNVFNGTPVWAYHGALDALIAPANTDQLTRNMRATGGRPIYSRPADQGHSGFDLFYTPGYFTIDSPSVTGGTGMNVYDWLFSQTLATGGAYVNPTAAVIVGMDALGWARALSGPLADGSGTIWYNRGYPSPNQGGGITAMVDTNGAETTLSMSFVSGSLNAFPRPDMDLYSAAIKSTFPTAAIGETYGVGSDTGYASPFVFSIGGLNDRSRYTFEIISAPEGAVSGFEISGREVASGSRADSYAGPLVLANVRPLNGTILLKHWYVSGFSAPFAAFRILRSEPMPAEGVLIIR